jgi:hypothetical protein
MSAAPIRETIASRADALWRAERDRVRVPISPLTDISRDLLIEDAYAVQSHNVDRRGAVRALSRLRSCRRGGRTAAKRLQPRGFIEAKHETSLRALSRAEEHYRAGCKRGGCGIRKHLMLGDVRHKPPVAERVLTDDERVEVICLNCRLRR